MHFSTEQKQSVNESRFMRIAEVGQSKTKESPNDFAKHASLANKSLGTSLKNEDTMFAIETRLSSVDSQALPGCKLRSFKISPKSVQ